MREAFEKKRALLRAYWRWQRRRGRAGEDRRSEVSSPDARGLESGRALRPRGPGGRAGGRVAAAATLQQAGVQADRQAGRGKRRAASRGGDGGGGAQQ